MKSKKTKIVSLIFCCMIFCMCFVGCGASSGSKKISVNVLASTMKFTNVSYYDFYNRTSVTSQNGNCIIISNTINGKEIMFEDPKGVTRVACVNTPLIKKPKKVRVYINTYKTEYDEYKCTY